MKKVLSVLLVLVLCMYLPCAVFAVSSPGSDGTAPTTPPATNPPADNPVTGDTFMPGLWFAVMVLALVALVVVIISYKKFSRK